MQAVKLIILSAMLSCLSACNSSGESTAATPVDPIEQIPTPPTSPTTPDKELQLQQILDNAIATSNTPGLVMAIADDQRSWLLSSGVKDVEATTAIEVDDSLRIASMTKLLVATVVLKLVEEGNLELDGLMVDYLDSQLINAIANYDQITVRQLLNMTSGIVDYTEVDAFNDAIDNEPTRIWQHDEVLSYIYDLDAVSSPGSEWHYSNTNYILLDSIVAAVSNSTLAAVFKRIIFTPLAMESSYLEFRQDSAANGTELSVEGYEGSEKVTDINDGIGFGDGGVVSTVADLTLFLDALFRQKSLLSQASLDEMLTEVMAQEYGLGAEIRTTSAGPIQGHNGASSGFQGELLYFPDQSITYVLLSNQEDSDVLDKVMAESLLVLKD